MSTAPYQGKFRLVCDDCRAPSARSDADKVALVATCRGAGWRVFRKAGAWRHSCPACVRKWAKKQSGEQWLI